MDLTFLKKFNWLDIFVLIILLRTTYVAIKSGVFIEFFKLLGTLLGCFVALHYFTQLSDFTVQSVPLFKEVNVVVFDFFSFFLLLLTGYMLFVIIREAFFKFVKTETASAINRWGSTFLGIVRGFIVSSLIIFLLSIPVFAYFNNSVKSSFSGRHLIKVSTGIYGYLWKNLASKFMPSAESNKSVLEIQDSVIKE